MTDSLPRILLCLFVINLGIAFGAGLYETRIEFPRWLSGTAARATSGTRLNYLRHALVLAAWLAALKAFAQAFA